MASVFEATAGKSIGYTSGLGGAVTQATSKSTGVTLNKPCGTITMHDASLAAAAEVRSEEHMSELPVTRSSRMPSSA